MRLRLTTARAFRSALQTYLDMMFALHLPPRRREETRDVRP